MSFGSWVVVYSDLATLITFKDLADTFIQTLNLGLAAHHTRSQLEQVGKKLTP